MGDGYMCGRNVKMKESLSHFCGISFLPKWDFFFAAYSFMFLYLYYCFLLVRRNELGNRLQIDRKFSDNPKISSYFCSIKRKKYEITIRI